LPTDARDGQLSRPKELAGRLAIREAMAEVSVLAVGIASVGIEYSSRMMS